jgi:hypothetical protein
LGVKISGPYSAAVFRIYNSLNPDPEPMYLWPKWKFYFISKFAIYFFLGLQAPSKKAILLFKTLFFYYFTVDFFLFGSGSGFRGLNADPQPYCAVK